MSLLNSNVTCPAACKSWYCSTASLSCKAWEIDNKFPLPAVCGAHKNETCGVVTEKLVDEGAVRPDQVKEALRRM